MSIKLAFTNEHKVSFILYGHTPHRLKGEILITDATFPPDITPHTFRAT